MNNNLVPIPLEQPVVEDVDEPTSIDYGKCLRCQCGLKESEYAIGDVCGGCRPAYMAAWESRQESEAELAAERRRYPEESDDDCDCCGYGCHRCGADQ